MDWQEEAARSVVRGAGYRVMRALPVWVSLVILLLALLFGGK